MASEPTPPPPARGVRIHWRDLDHEIRSAIEQRSGSSVVASETQPAGFSPGLAARLRLANGQSLFVKAIHPRANPTSPGLHRREASIAAQLPHAAPVPRFLWSIDQGPDGWVVLAFEDVEGRHPKEPWDPAELRRVVEAVEQLREALTPTPIRTETAAEFYRREVWSWASLRDQLGRREVDEKRLDPWIVRNLEALVDLDERSGVAVEGDTLLHLDLRADNILLAGDRVYIVDWPHARVGAAVTDVIGMAPSVAMQGGPLPEVFGELHSAFRSANPGAVTAIVGADAGFLVHRSVQPPPAGLPTLRSFQAAQGEVALNWLRERTGWP